VAPSGPERELVKKGANKISGCQYYILYKVKSFYKVLEHEGNIPVRRWRKNG